MEKIEELYARYIESTSDKTIDGHLPIETFKEVTNLTVTIDSADEVLIDYLPPKLKVLILNIIGSINVVKLVGEITDLRRIEVIGGKIDILETDIQNSPRFKMISTDDGGAIGQINTNGYPLTDVFIDVPELTNDTFKYLPLHALENLGLYTSLGWCDFKGLSFPQLDTLDIRHNLGIVVNDFTIDAPGLCELTLHVGQLTFDNNFQFEGTLNLNVRDFSITKWNNLSGLVELKVNSVKVDLTVPEDMIYLNAVKIQAQEGKVNFGESSEYLTKITCSGGFDVELPVECPKLSSLCLSKVNLMRFPRFLPSLEYVSVVTETEKINVDLSSCEFIKELKIMLPESGTFKLPEKMSETRRIYISSKSPTLKRIALPTTMPKLIALELVIPWLRGIEMAEDSVDITKLVLETPILTDILMPVAYRKLDSATVPPLCILTTYRPSNLASVARL